MLKDDLWRSASVAHTYVSSVRRWYTYTGSDMRSISRVVRINVANTGCKQCSEDVRSGKVQIDGVKTKGEESGRECESLVSRGEI